MGTARATAVFDGNDRPLLGTIKRIKGQLGSLQRSFRSGASNLAVTGFKTLGAASVAAGVGLAFGVKRALDLGDSLADASAKTGIAIDQIMILQQAGKDNGIENITASVAKMQKSLVSAVADGASPAADALDRLGLSGQQLIRDTPVGALQKIGDRINAIENPAMRAATAMELFGKSGAELLPLFADTSALGTAAASLGRQAEVMKQNAAAFGVVSDRLNRSGLKLQGFTVGVAKGLLPALDKFTAKFDKVDLVGQGERFAKAMTDAGTEFAKGFNTANIQGGMDLALAGVLGKGLGKAVEFGGGVAKGAQALMSSIKQGTLMKDMLGAVVGGGVVHAGDSKLNALLEARMRPLRQMSLDRKARTPWKAVHNWDMSKSASRLTGGGLAGGSMANRSAFDNFFSAGRPAFVNPLNQPARRSTALLPASERRAFENAMFAETGKRPALGGAYGTVRRGDAAARKEAARAAERKKNEDKLGVARSNQLLEDVVGVLKEGLL